MENKKIKLIAGSSIIAAAILGIGAFALFTDNDNEDIKAKAGTVGVDIANINLTNSGNINPGDNDESVPETYIPDPNDPLYKDEDKDGKGDPVSINTTPHDLTFNVSNTGNKSIRTRQTLIVTCKDTEKNILDPSHLSLLIEKGVEIGNNKEIEKKLYVLENGEEVSELKKDDKVTAIKYQIISDTFDGVGNAAELETDTTVKNEKNVAVKTYTYLLKMDTATPNKYQGAKINIDVVIEAIQYRNTAQSDWQIMSTQSISGVLTGLNSKKSETTQENTEKLSETDKQ